MINRWRSEIEQGRRDADAIVGRMRLVVWQMVKVCFAAGLVIGALLAGGLVWLMK